MTSGNILGHFPEISMEKYKQTVDAIATYTSVNLLKYIAAMTLLAFQTFY